MHRLTTASVRRAGAEPPRRLTVRVAWLVAPHTVRAMRWRPLLAAAAVGFAVVAIPSATTVLLSDRDLTNLLRLAAVCAGIGAAFLLDDPAARSTVAVPTGRLARHAVRAAIALPALAAWWTAAVLTTLAGAEQGIGATVPVRAVTLEAGALVAAAVGLAAIGLRFAAADGAASTLAAPALLVLATIMRLLPERVALFAAPGDPQWTVSHRLWWLVLVAALTVAAWASRDR